MVTLPYRKKIAPGAPRQGQKVKHINMSTQSIADQTWLDKYLPTDDMNSDPRWFREEFGDGNFVWAWKPATIDFLDGVFVAQVGSRIERHDTLAAADWWCREVMDVLPVISPAAESVPVELPRRALAQVMNAAALIAGFVAVLLPLAIL